jgi:hypothetical protein
MPPKKTKDVASKRDDQRFNYPVNECRLAIQIEAVHEGAHNFKILYDWFTQKDEALEQCACDTGMFRDWQVLKIDGED